MKNMIISLAIVLLIANFMMFQKDSYNLVYAMNAMKNIADDMARSAALSIDYEKLSEGKFSFNQTEGKYMAKRAFDEQIAAFEKRNHDELFDYRNVKYDLSFNEASGKVTVNIDLGKANYKLPYLRNNKDLKVDSVYEYVLKDVKEIVVSE